MTGRSHLLVLVACLSIVVITAACAPLPPPAAPTAAPAATAAPSNEITDIVWQWTTLKNKTTNETTTVSNPQNYTITFRKDGTLSGKADCNNFTGTYSQASGFSIKLGASTMAACPEGSLDQQYLQLLSSVAAGGPDGQGNLALETAGGEQRMLFKNGGAAPAQ
jgi:heat shock protein HslJ